MRIGIWGELNKLFKKTRKSKSLKEIGIQIFSIVLNKILRGISSFVSRLLCSRISKYGFLKLRTPSGIAAKIPNEHPEKAGLSLRNLKITKQTSTYLDHLKMGSLFVLLLLSFSSSSPGHNYLNMLTEILPREPASTQTLELISNLNEEHP